MAGRRIRAAAAAILLAGATLSPIVASAVQPDEVLTDAALESRARTLSAGLRCMVCQNQSIDDSDAPLARDLRMLVRQRLLAGDSDDDVTAYLVSRYGQFVLLRPRLEWSTLALWGTPAVLLAAGAGFMLRGARRRRRPEVARLTAEEEQALERALGPDR